MVMVEPRANQRRWERRRERGGLSRIVLDRDVEPEAYRDVLAAFLESPPRSSLRVTPKRRLSKRH